MTDEQLQSLFAGMERHLDKRADEIEKRVEASEQRLRDEIKEANHNLETKLITEFWKWASPVEARARGSRDTLHALELEVDSLKERMRKLEGERPPQ